MRRAFALSLLLLAACGRAPTSDPAPSGLTGRVLLFPTCPVEIAASPCPRKGVQTTVNVESSDGERMLQVRTRPDGTFRTVLEPGTYLLSAAPPGGSDLVPRPATARVEPGSFARVTLILDTRLREP